MTSRESRSNRSGGKCENARNRRNRDHATRTTHRSDKAWLWQDQLESGKYESIDEIAAENNVDRTHVSRIMQLTSLSPTIVEQILEGKEPESMSLRQLRKGIPLLWSEQGKMSEA